jgi:stage V sporulation protein B
LIRSKVLLVNSLILCAAALGLQTLALLFRTYLAKVLGPEGMGLLQLTATLQLFSTALATMGLRLTVSRLAAQELASRHFAGAVRVARVCLLFGLISGAGAMVVLSFSAPWLGTVLLKDPRTILALRVFAWNLPFVALSAVFNGYFVAVDRAYDVAVTQILEQAVELGVAVFLLRRVASLGLSGSCAAIALSSGIGEALSCVLQYILYRRDAMERLRKGGVCAAGLSRRMLSTAIPIAGSMLAATGTRAVENLLIPLGLRQGGATEAVALSIFGLIHGMVMPLLLFPAQMMVPPLELLLPELAASQASGHIRHLNYMVNRVVRIELILSVGIAWFFWNFSRELGMLFFHSTDIAPYLRILAFLAPLLYLDLLFDMILKGLGKQVYSLKNDLYGSAVDIFLLWILLPRFGVGGYLIATFASAALKFCLSIRGVASSARLELGVWDLGKILLCMIGASIVTFAAWNLFSFTREVSLHPVLRCCITLLNFWGLLRLTSCISKEDVVWLRSLTKAN